MQWIYRSIPSVQIEPRHISIGRRIAATGNSAGNDLRGKHRSRASLNGRTRRQSGSQGIDAEPATKMFSIRSSRDFVKAQVEALGRSMRWDGYVKVLVQ